MNPIEFFNKQTENSKTLPIRVHITQLSIFAFGKFDGATMRIEVSPDDFDPHDPSFDPDVDMTWFDHPNGTYTDPTANDVRFWNNAEFGTFWIRGVIENAGAETELSLKALARTLASH